MGLAKKERVTGPATIGVLTFDKKGRTTFTGRMRKELEIDDETYVIVERTERGTFELVPAALVPNDQVWFHHSAIQARVAKAEDDFVKGRSTRTDTPDEAQALLDRLKRPATRKVSSR